MGVGLCLFSSEFLGSKQSHVDLYPLKTQSPVVEVIHIIGTWDWKRLPELVSPVLS